LIHVRSGSRKNFIETPRPDTLKPYRFYAGKLKPSSGFRIRVGFRKHYPSDAGLCNFLRTLKARKGSRVQRRSPGSLTSRQYGGDFGVDGRAPRHRTFGPKEIFEVDGAL
jgi:hypothetical protein